MKHKKTISKPKIVLLSVLLLLIALIPGWYYYMSFGKGIMGTYSNGFHTVTNWSSANYNHAWAFWSIALTIFAIAIFLKIFDDVNYGLAIFIGLGLTIAICLICGVVDHNLIPATVTQSVLTNTTTSNSTNVTIIKTNELIMR